MKLSSPARRWALVASAALLSVTVAACGSENDETGNDASSSVASSDSAAESPSASPSASESASEAPADLPAWAPAVVTDGDLVTGLDFTGTPEPTDELLVATVSKGDGPPVEVGQTITANYLGSVYQGTEPFDESFSTQPFQAPIGVGRLIQGWDKLIPGVPVGSRIIMSVPPELGYGDQEVPGIPAGSTLFFVIDILDAA
ncbi:FKBP-type peptidyl-prolyl cis-trans isomerase [Nocardioides rubriscoriae]|uniref:FKBP-type peptidyl-prolyl cis-trans isomerase n=1 Tax=Nocardioides rubriscoriae TaxID=642762 RepID=UPI0011DFC080|nr:FKBP-type peptidyl-prolyl cis-trans isomerase [Nocardioides rubriscoriae]